MYTFVEFTDQFRVQLETRDLIKPQELTLIQQHIQFLSLVQKLNNNRLFVFGKNFSQPEINQLELQVTDQTIKSNAFTYVEIKNVGDLAQFFRTNQELWVTTIDYLEKQMSEAQNTQLQKSTDSTKRWTLYFVLMGLIWQFANVIGRLTSTDRTMTDTFQGLGIGFTVGALLIQCTPLVTLLSHYLLCTDRKTQKLIRQFNIEALERVANRIVLESTEAQVTIQIEQPENKTSFGYQLFKPDNKQLSKVDNKTLGVSLQN